MKIWYTVPDHDEESRYSCDVPMWAEDRDDQAEECAEHYHDQCDGARDEWPLTFVIHDSEDGPEVARFKVERVLTPMFSAREVKCK